MDPQRLPIWERDWACFLICIGLGIPLLLFLRLPEEMPDWSVWVATAFLSLIIGAYAFVIWLWRSPTLGRNERAADNLYFLGFIFTVCALGISLYRYYDTPDSVPVERIMGDLGIGIITTVVGLVFRVLVLHRDDPADTEERVREQIVDFAQSTMSRLYQTSEVVSQGHTANLQVVSELTGAMQQSSARVREQSSQMILNLEEAAKSIAGFSETVDQLAAPVEQMPNELAKAVSEMQQQSMRQLRSIASDFHLVIAEFLRSAQDQVSDSISTTEQILVSRVKEISVPSEEVNQLRQKMLTGFDTQSQELMRSFEQVSNAMRRVTQALDQVERDLRAQPAALANSLDSLRDGTGSFFSHAREELANLANSVSALNIDRIVDGMREVEQLSQENGRAIADQRHASSELSGKLTELINEIRVLRKAYSDGPQQKSSWCRRR